jgi:hypothetical protein
MPEKSETLDHKIAFVPLVVGVLLRYKCRGTGLQAYKKYVFCTFSFVKGLFCVKLCTISNGFVG